MMSAVRRSLLALTVLAAVVVTAVWIARTTADPRSPIARAVATVPAETATLSVTDWAAVRAELDLNAATAGDPAGLRRLAGAGFATDLTAVSLLVGSAEPMQRLYGWSVASADWEAYAQSGEGAVAVVALGGIPAETVLDGLASTGYAEPAEGADAGSIWRGGPDVVATADPGLTPQLGYVAVLADDGLVIASDAADYAARTVAAVRGSVPSLAADADVARVALGLSGAPVAVLHTGERGCRVTSLSDADRATRATGDRLAAAAGGLADYAALGLALGLTDTAGTLDVVMRFADAALAADQLAVRAALTVGDAPAQGGTWEERFTLAAAAAEGPTVTLRLRAPTRDAQLLSDLGTGGLLFAGCPTSGRPSPPA